MVIYLGWLLPATSCGSSHNRERLWDTALHTRKDLAVSPHSFHYELSPKGSLTLSHQSVSARTSCVAADGYYPLRVSKSVKIGCVRTFLCLKEAATIVPAHYNTLIIFFNNSCDVYTVTHFEVLAGEQTRHRFDDIPR